MTQCVNIVVVEAESNDPLDHKLKGAILVLTRLIPILLEHVHSPLADPSQAEQA